MRPNSKAWRRCVSRHRPGARQESLRLAAEKMVSTRARRPAIETAGKVVAHFRAYSVDAPGFLAAFGGNDAAGSELLTDVGVVEFAIELGVGQHQADGADGVRGIHQRTQIGAIVGGAGVGLLREYGDSGALTRISHHVVDE